MGQKVMDDEMLKVSSNEKPSPLLRVKSVKIDDEREVHVVEDEEHQKELERLHPDIYATFNITIKGSAEHVKALRAARDHHNSKSQELHSKYPEAISRYERIRHELDELSKDLNEISPTRNVHLEANFGKFGYSANIKQRVISKKEGEYEGSTTMKIYKAPTIRQYFHKGLLWRAADKEEVASFELFVDLLYVGIIAINGDRATEDPNGDTLLRFCFTFIMSWRIWTDVTLMVSWFETDDMMQRAGILFILSSLVGFTTNIVSSTMTTYSQLIAFFLAARLFVMFLLLFMAWVIAVVRPIMIWNSFSVLIPSILWIASTTIEEPRRWILIWLAIFLDVAFPHLIVFFMMGPPVFGKRFNAWVKQIFSFYPAVNIEHRTERIGAFVSLVFGYTVVALLYQNQASFGMNAFFGKAVLGLIQCFCFNTIYFDIDASNHFQHAIRRHILTSNIWIVAHLPFIMGFTLSGAALSRLVVAHDCRDAEIDHLTETYQERSLEVVESGIRWFYCGGLSVAVLCLAIISACHHHTPLETQRLRKMWRLIYRCFVALVWILLPLARERLSSLSLISITTAMTVSVLILDIYGTSCRHESFFSFQKDCTRCYRAKLESGTNTAVGSTEDILGQVVDSNPKVTGKDHPVNLACI